MSADAAAVIVPVGGADDALAQQLRAILLQDVEVGLEVVLSLNTADVEIGARVRQIVGTFADPRLRVIDSSHRRGAAHARNAGVAATDRQLLAFCDADDLVHPGWLASLLDGLASFDAVTGRIVDVFPNDRVAAWHPPTTPGDLPRFLGRSYLLSGNMAVRRGALLAVGGFDESLTRCEDIALGWALQRAGFSIGYAPGAVLDYRHRAGLSPMLVQHYRYGRGMSEVLQRFGVPGADGESGRTGLRSLRPNAQPVRRHTIGGTLRRVAIGLGRVRGMLGRQRVAAVPAVGVDAS